MQVINYIFIFFLFFFRVTQVYDSGVCIYFYFGFNYKGLENPLETYDTIEVCEYKK